MDTGIKQCRCTQETEKEKYAKIAQIIDECKDKKGSLIQILHLAQGIYGYLPVELQKFIAVKMGIPPSKVFGVATFYSFFSTKAKGGNTIRVCLGTACYVLGGKAVLDKLSEILDVKVGGTTEDGRFTLEVMRCIGACGLAPVITVNDKIYQKVETDKLQEILDKYLKAQG